MPGVPIPSGAVRHKALRHAIAMILAANLIMGAERKYAKLNPPMSPKESASIAGKARQGIISEEVADLFAENPLSKTEIKDIRKAHNKLSDEEFERAKEDSVEKGGGGVRGVGGRPKPRFAPPGDRIPGGFTQANKCLNQPACV